MAKKYFLHPLLATTAVLLIALIAMQFNDQMRWSFFDFIAMGALIFAASVALEFITKQTGKYKLPAVGAIVLLFIWLWAELAVGVFTSLGS